MPMPLGEPSCQSPTARLANAPSANCPAPNTAAAAPAFTGYRCIRSVVQLADNSPTPPTTKNKPKTIDHNPPHPVSETRQTNRDAMQLTVAAKEMIGTQPSCPTQRVFITFPNIIPTIFTPNT